MKSLLLFLKFSKRAYCSLSLIIVCFFSHAVFASNGNYQIEMIIFSHLTSQTLGSEQWPILSPDFVTPTLTDNTKSQLPRSQLTLDNTNHNIARQSGYRVVSYLAWQEHLTGSTQHFTLFHGNLYDSQGNLVSKNFSNTAQINAQNPSLLNGNFSLTLGHYIDTTLNLYLIEPTAMLKQLANNNYFNHINAANFVFQLSESRRMRSQELNYFWHPTLGVLIKITPIHHDLQTKT